MPEYGLSTGGPSLSTKDFTESPVSLDQDFGQTSASMLPKQELTPYPGLSGTSTLGGPGLGGGDVAPEDMRGPPAPRPGYQDSTKQSATQQLAGVASAATTGSVVGTYLKSSADSGNPVAREILRAQSEVLDALGDEIKGWFGLPTAKKHGPKQVRGTERAKNNPIEEANDRDMLMRNIQSAKIVQARASELSRANRLTIHPAKQTEDEYVKNYLLRYKLGPYGGGLATPNNVGWRKQGQLANIEATARSNYSKGLGYDGQNPNQALGFSDSLMAATLGPRKSSTAAPVPVPPPAAAPEPVAPPVKPAPTPVDEEPVIVDKPTPTPPPAPGPWYSTVTPETEANRAPHPTYSAPRYTPRQYDALFANEAYEDPTKRGKIGGYVYDASLSSPRHAVYHNPSNGKTYLSFRGTTFDTSHDVKHWPNVINGNLDKTARMKDALAMYDAVSKKYGSTGKPRVVGHSLGASLAQQVVRERPGSSGAGFNQGSSIFGSDKDLAKKCAGKKAPTVCRDFRQHRIGGDGVSASQTYYKTSNIQQTYKGNPASHQSLGPLGKVINPLKAHDMANFTDANSDFWSKAGKDAYYRKPSTRNRTRRRRRRGG